MTKEDAYKRMFAHVYVCMDCNAKVRAQEHKIKVGKVMCRKCGSHALRVRSKESRG